MSRGTDHHETGGGRSVAGWIARGGRLLTALAGLRRDDVWLACYPKAGSTWIRFLLCNVAYVEERDGAPVNFETVSRTMPSFGRSDLTREWPFQAIPRMVKTHQPYRPFLFGIPTRSVYVLRDPRDMMVSYYHYVHANRLVPFEGGFAEFIRADRFGLRSCLAHWASWHDRARITIRYEDLKEDAAGELERLLVAVAGTTPSPEVIEQAVERSRVDRMRSVQREGDFERFDRFESDFEFVREARSRQWVDWFDEADLDYYRSLRREFGFDLYD